MVNCAFHTEKMVTARLKTLMLDFQTFLKAPAECEGYLNAAGQLQLYRYLYADRLANPNLQWEKTTSWNFGLDFGFLNDRITGSLEYYTMQTHDMIMIQRLPSFTGFAFITTNLGQVDNNGVEFALNTVNIRNAKFQWNTTFGLSYNRNRITHLYYDQEDIKDANGNIISSKERDDINNGWFIGKPIGAIWDYRVTGIWQANEVAEAKRVRPVARRSKSCEQLHGR